MAVLSSFPPSLYLHTRSTRVMLVRFVKIVRDPHEERGPRKDLILKIRPYKIHVRIMYTPLLYLFLLDKTKNNVQVVDLFCYPNSIFIKE